MNTAIMVSKFLVQVVMGAWLYHARLGYIVTDRFPRSGSAMRVRERRLLRLCPRQAHSTSTTQLTRASYTQCSNIPRFTSPFRTPHNQLKLSSQAYRPFGVNMPLELNGYSAHICCDGKELETYDVRVEDEKTISCWIPSEEGKVRAFTLSPSRFCGVLARSTNEC